VGTDTSYGTRVFGKVDSSTDEVRVAIALSNLQPGATYHYRLCATDVDGTTYGGDETFTTPGYSNSIILPATPALVPYAPIAVPTETTGLRGTKALTSAQKLAKALKACRKDRKSKRAGCERQARKKYGR
jgi:hypothetical protein